MTIWPFRSRLEKLRIELAGVEARLQAIEKLMDELDKFPQDLAWEYVNVYERRACLIERIAAFERINR